MSGYLFIQDVPGQSVDADHKDWINLTSISEGMSRPVVYGGSGSTRNVSSVSHGDIVCTKESDKSTPKLIEAVCDGTVFKTVKIDLVQSLGEKKRVPYLQWELKNVIVTSYSLSAALDQNSGSPPAESISLNFEEAKWIFTQYKKEGGKEGKVEATWKTEEGTA